MNNDNFYRSSTDTRYNRSGNDNSVMYNDRYSGSDGYLPFYRSGDSSQQDQAPDRYTYSSSRVSSVTQLTDSKEYVDPRQEELERNKAKLMLELPYNGSDNAKGTAVKRLRILWMIGAVIVYGGFAGGLVCFLFQKLTATFHGSDDFVVGVAFIFILAGVFIFVLCSRSVLNRIKNCTVKIEGMIVSYKISRLTDEYGRYMRKSYRRVIGYIL